MPQTDMIWMGAALGVVVAFLAVRRRKLFEAGSMVAFSGVLALTAAGQGSRHGPLMLILALTGLGFLVTHFVQVWRHARADTGVSRTAGTGAPTESA